MDTSKAINHISLCAGYGGIDLGLRRVFPTCRTVAYVEIEAFAVANLVAKMEEGELDQAPIWTNLKTLPLEAFPTGLEIISGGFPCQPFSAAGKREGDEDPRHLFPYIKNAIRTIQPQWVFLENVEGIISAKLKGDGWEDPAGTPVLLHVIRELERVGYRATAGVFSAAEVGATHQRKRVFILAHSGSTRSTVRLPELQQWGEGHAEVSDYRSYRNWPVRPGEPQHEWEEPRVVADATGAELYDERKRAEGRTGITGSGEGAMADAHSNESASIRGDNGEVPQVSAEQGQEHCAVVSGGEGEERGVVGDADSGRQLQSKRSEQALGGWDSNPSAELANAKGDDEQGCGSRPGQGQSRGEGAEQRDETESQLGGTVDGATSGLDPTANRVDRLRLLGNGVVPDTAEVAFRTLYKELMDEQQSNQS